MLTAKYHQSVRTEGEACKVRIHKKKQTVTCGQKIGGKLQIVERQKESVCNMRTVRWKTCNIRAGRRKTPVICGLSEGKSVIREQTEEICYMRAQAETACSYADGQKQET